MNKKTMGFGVLSAAAVLGMASAALACTTYKGKATVTTGTQSTWAYGSGSGMNYCSGPTDSNPANTVPGANLNNSGSGTFNVAVAPTGTGVTGCNNTQLRDTNHSSDPLIHALGHRHYYVRYVNPGFTYTGSNPRSYSWSVDCMEGASGSRVPSNTTAEMVVSGGSGNKNVTLTSAQMGGDSAAGQTAAVCVSSNGGGEGMQVPLQII